MPHYSLKEANFRVFLSQRQGGRKYMEDVVMIRDHKKENSEEEFVFWAVFDGHGGAEAALFAREHLLNELKNIKAFWSTDPDEVSRAIKEAFIVTHRLMWKNVGNWPKTLSGLPSTAGTTASVVIIKDGKIYVAHVGDSSVVIGEEKATWQRFIANCVTTDHKPEDPEEKKRIQDSGGQVTAKAGVQRVVWHRPKPSHKGPVRRSTPIDDIPFLAVARALGDLWSYNSEHDVFVVSPEPDIAVFDLDPKKHKFVILASDGLWNMVKPEQAVAMVEEMEERDAHKFTLSYNPALKLVSLALDRWANKKMRADNTSVVLAFIDPPGQSPSPLLVTDTQLSDASTITLSDSDSVHSGRESPKQPAVVNKHFPGVQRHRYWDDLFPSPRHIGFGGHVSTKHINSVWGKTPKLHKHRHLKAKTPNSCPPKLTNSEKLKQNKINKSLSSPLPVKRVSQECPSPSSSFTCMPSSDLGASPLLNSNKRKASSEYPESLIAKISPLQSSSKKNSSKDCGPSSPKKMRTDDSSDGELHPIIGLSEADYVSQEVIVSTSEIDCATERAQKPSTSMDSPERGLTSDTPLVATSAKSPLKIDTQEKSPSLGVVSPIWPSCLENDIDLDVASTNPGRVLDVKIKAQVGSCVLRENYPKSSLVTKAIPPRKCTYAKTASKYCGSQNKVTKATYKRKPAQGNMARITLHKLRVRTKRPFKLRNTQHRTRFQVNGSFTSNRRS